MSNESEKKAKPDPAVTDTDKTAKHTAGAAIAAETVRNWIAGVLILLIAGSTGWLFLSVSDHNTDIADMKARIEALDKGIERLEEDIENIEDLMRERWDVPVVTHGDSVSVDTEKLIAFVKEQQAQYVFDSYGELRGQNFSEEALAEFMQRDVPAQIVAQLENDNNFIAVIEAMKDLHPSERQDLLTRCASTYEQTWAQLGEISRRGQTEAGQTAERLIAEAIADLARRLVRLSKEEIRALYN